MKKRIVSYIFLPALLLMLGLVLACSGGASPETVPVTLPTDATPLSPRPLSTSDLMAVEEFELQRQAVGQEWDQFHQDFDQWRAGLTTCHRNAVRESLEDFAVSFNAVTERARELPRTSVSREYSDMLIAAAEAEESAFRQLRDRWQPNSLSLFEALEQQRSEAARVQRNVEDLALELEEELEEASDPKTLEAIEDLSQALGPIGDDWEISHYDYASLLKDALRLDDIELLARLDQLIRQSSAVVEAIDELAATDATEDAIKELQGVAEVEHRALTKIYATLSRTIKEPSVPSDDPVTPGEDESVIPAGPTAGQLLESLQPIVKKAETTLKEVKRTINKDLDGSAMADLEEVQEFIVAYEILLTDWAEFYLGYNNWRRTEGGCDRTEVLEDLSQFHIRIGELGRKVRDLPQSGYLLPMYNLLVEAAEREEGAVRTLRTSWQPFTVDAFIAVDRERDNANKLRREASIALVELTDRS